jgi:glutamine cyclotransferase
VVQRLRARVLASYPHDPTAYTQGLLLHDGSLYESTGGYGSSRLRRVELATGRVLADRELPADWFGEGLARVPAAGGGRLVQLTWREGVAQAWSLPDLERISLTHYEGEGWGLCWDDSVPLGRLVMSDGSSRLTFREPEGLAVTGGVEVTLDGRPVAYLNELECVGGRVYANVFTTDEIVEIDPRSGRVTAVVDASGLLDAGEAATAEVLNGIAWDPGDGSFLVTGKLWPRLFRVELVPAG